jgi:hypothetical protein
MKRRPRLLQDARVYLSGPMDFVASRADEKKSGWRNRVGEFLKAMDVTVFDPWVKPELRGLHEYGREDVGTTRVREAWTFRKGEKGAAARSACAGAFWPSMHVDLRMVDTSDFVIAYCPTNIYSVGTPHEIILCRQQRKPVLFVSPRIVFPTLDQLERHLAARGDAEGANLLATLKAEAPIIPNAAGVPSLWYLPLVGSEHFFDGFGFAEFRRRFGWKPIALDEHEANPRPQKPLLPFLEELNRRLPKKWDHRTGKFAPNDDWLLWNLKRGKRRGAEMTSVHQVVDPGAGQIPRAR